MIYLIFMFSPNPHNSHNSHNHYHTYTIITTITIPLPTHLLNLEICTLTQALSPTLLDYPPPPTSTKQCQTKYFQPKATTIKRKYSHILPKFEAYSNPINYKKKMNYPPPNSLNKVYFYPTTRELHSSQCHLCNYCHIGTISMWTNTKTTPSTTHPIHCPNMWPQHCNVTRAPIHILDKIKIQFHILETQLQCQIHTLLLFISPTTQTTIRILMPTHRHAYRWPPNL